MSNWKCLETLASTRDILEAASKFQIQTSNERPRRLSIVLAASYPLLRGPHVTGSPCYGPVTVILWALEYWELGLLGGGASRPGVNNPLRSLYGACTDPSRAYVRNVPAKLNKGPLRGFYGLFTDQLPPSP